MGQPNIKQSQHDVLVLRIACLVEMGF